MKTRKLLKLYGSKSFNKVITTKCINRNNKSTKLVLFLDPCTSEEQSTNCTSNQFNASYELLPCFNPPTITTKLYGAFHVKSNVNRPYMKRNEGGRGLISIRDCVDAETRNLNAYIANSEEDLFKFASTALNLDPAAIEEKENFQKRLVNQRRTELKSMKLHGQFENHTEEIKVKESWDWLRRGDLKRETEALIMPHYISHL